MNTCSYCKQMVEETTPIDSLRVRVCDRKICRKQALETNANRQRAIAEHLRLHGLTQLELLQAESAILRHQWPEVAA